MPNRTTTRAPRRIAWLSGLCIGLLFAPQCAELGDSPLLCLVLEAPSGCGAGTAGAGANGGGDPGDPGSGPSTPGISIPVSVQTGTLTIAGTGGLGTFTETAVITAVNTDSSFLIFQSRFNSGRPPVGMVRGRIANSTTVEFTKVTNETAVTTIRWYVVEYPPAYVRVQTGLSPRNPNPRTVAITAVGALNRAFVMHSQTAGGGANSWGSDDPANVSLSALDTLRINAGSGSTQHTLRWQVVEYLDADHLNVQTNAASLTGGALSANVNLTTAVNTSRSISLAALATTGVGSDIGARMIRARYSDSSTIVVERAIPGGGDDLTEIITQSIEFKDGSTVQSGTASFTAGVGTRNIAITTTDTTKSAALVSGELGAGQSMGMTSFNSDDNPGICSVTTTLTSTQLTLERDRTTGSCDVAWYVIKFGTD